MKNNSHEEQLPKQEGDSSQGTSTPRVIKKSKIAKYVFIAIVTLAILTAVFLVIK